MFFMPEPGQAWLHYKGARCTIQAVVIDATTGRPAVVYAAASNGRVFVRDLGEFLGFTEGHERRFTCLGRAPDGPAT